MQFIRRGYAALAVAGSIFLGCATVWVLYSNDPLPRQAEKVEYQPPAAPVIPVTVTPLPRDVLVSTSREIPGNTIAMLGKQKAFACFHPDFVKKLAGAIQEARSSGLPGAGVFSACRPPALGIGGFRDKFNSLHAYGLAADMAGIGGPGSADAKKWHAIAKRHGIACIYGPHNNAEWNHCQGTPLHVAPQALRRTITAEGPRDIEKTWDAATPFLAPNFFTPPPPEKTKRKKRVRHYVQHHPSRDPFTQRGETGRAKPPLGHT